MANGEDWRRFGVLEDYMEKQCISFRFRFDTCALSAFVSYVSKFWLCNMLKIKGMVMDKRYGF